MSSLEEWTQRIYDEKDKEAFETVKNYMDDNSRNYSKQEAGLFAVRLAAQRIKDLQHEKDSVNVKLP